MRLGVGIGLGFGGGGVTPSPVISFNVENGNFTDAGAGAISAWVNLANPGTNNLAQGISARRPVWTDNGAPSGAADIMTCASDGVNPKQGTVVPASALFGLAGYTVFVVVNKSANTGVTTGVCLYNTGAVRGGWQLEHAGLVRSFQARTSGGTVKSVTFGTATLNTWEIWTIKNWGGGSDDVDSSANFKTRVNGAEVAWTVGTGGPWFWIPTSHSLTWGPPAATAGNDLKTASYRAYASYLSDGECLAIERQLGALYGISVP